MSFFAIRYPYFILMVCLTIIVVGVAAILSMPVDLFPPINIPVVVVATFYSGMPPEQIESDITDSDERFFTLGSNIDHIESRSMSGVSLIKIYFQPGTDPTAAVSNISNLAMANLRRLPPGTLPPVVLSFDAANLPVCLITLKGAGMSQTQLKDVAQFTVRNQVANVPGASVPQPYGGTYRQIMVYVDPLKLEASQLGVMDVVHAINESNLILPAGDVRIGPKDYNIYANSQVPAPNDVNSIPLKTVGNASILVGDVGHAVDGGQLQTNIVRVDGQHSVYIPVLKQGGDSNTITIVNGIRKATAHLLDIPSQLKTSVVFDQSVFVKTAIKNVISEGAIGLCLTGIMILLFLGNFRATIAVMLSIPISCIATFLILKAFGDSINTMVLGGMALVLSRLIDNSVVVLENIFRHFEMGSDSVKASQEGGKEVQLAVLAATFSTAIVFFPVVLLTGVSKYLFTALALAVVIALFCSYVVAMTVVPLFCSKFIKHTGHENAHEAATKDDPAPEHMQGGRGQKNPFAKVVYFFNQGFGGLQRRYDGAIRYCLERPALVVIVFSIFVVVSFALSPFLGRAYFPRTDPGQFVISVKAPTGTRLELTDQYIGRVEDEVRSVIAAKDLNMIVSNIGVSPDLSAIYTPNSGMHTAFVQVSLNEDHSLSSFAYMQRVRKKLSADLPEVQTYFQTGGLVDSIVNQGLPAPFDIQVSSNNMEGGYAIAQQITQRMRGLRGVNDVLIPQDIDYPGLALNINREQASLEGLTPKTIVDSVITAMTSNGMVAPSYWIDPKTGNNYMLTVQYPESQVQTLNDFKQIPLRSADGKSTTPLETVASIKSINTPTEVDHYQLRRVFDIYVMPKSEDLSTIGDRVSGIVAGIHPPKGTVLTVRGSVNNMKESFQDFAIGLILSIILVFLILMAQFASFVDPFIILLAIPPGLSGVILFLLVTHTTLNIMSLMGVLMMTGIVVSDSILIVEFVGQLREQGYKLEDAIITACKVRLRPILMTTLATVLGLIPMALALEAGSEQYAPLARAILGGLTVSGIVTVFLVPSAYLLIHRRREARDEGKHPQMPAQENEATA
ncbi:multidrug efflux pump subunit AcrB [Silvibacterium bohemicum]|uniref:Multidrug efflux pump subunit AcrB n=1 Tax=Silvibacterium bohemicum TaxID=1577686 RepID=A0A841JZQ8_9BACT|nr:efflux RND transporter permease subunit [Silvibacterium bohemicum]MBB6143908.1 multidrug efflux pump subunit AcrB [Silvibacterium bohemicum]